MATRRGLARSLLLAGTLLVGTAAPALAQTPDSVPDPPPTVPDPTTTVPEPTTTTVPPTTTTTEAPTTTVPPATTTTAAPAPVEDDQVEVEPLTFECVDGGSEVTVLVQGDTQASITLEAAGEVWDLTDPGTVLGPLADETEVVVVVDGLVVERGISPVCTGPLAGQPAHPRSTQSGDEGPDPVAKAIVGRDLLNCSNFQFQEDAQAEFDQDPSDPNNLDQGGVPGKACEDLPSRGAVSTPAPTVPANSTGELANTGLETGPVVLAGLLLVLTGAGALAARRRLGS